MRESSSEGSDSVLSDNFSVFRKVVLQMKMSKTKKPVRLVPQRENVNHAVRNRVRLRSRRRKRQSDLRTFSMMIKWRN